MEYTSDAQKCIRRVSPLLGYIPALEREFPHSVRKFFYFIQRKEKEKTEFDSIKRVKIVFYRL